MRLEYGMLVRGPEGDGWVFRHEQAPGRITESDIWDQQIVALNDLASDGKWRVVHAAGEAYLLVREVESDRARRTIEAIDLPL